MDSSLSRLNGRFPVTTRIFGGFALVLVLLAGLATLAVTNLQEIRSDFIGYSAVARTTLTTMGLNNEFTELRRGVGRLLKPPRRADRIVTVERDSPEHEQAPRRQRMIELAPERHAAFEQWHRLIEPALRPGRGPEGHINP